MYWDTLGYTGIRWDTLGYTGIHRDTLEYGGIHRDTLGYIGIHWSVLDVYYEAIDVDAGGGCQPFTKPIYYPTTALLGTTQWVVHNMVKMLSSKSKHTVHI